MLSRDLLREMFEYDEDTGWFTNRYSRGRAAEGTRAGSPTGHGYRKIMIGYNKYYEHHLAWLYMYGEWPDEIDHKDGDRSNNKIGNLRLSTRTQNNANGDQTVGQSGHRGVYWDARVSKWYAKIQVGGIPKYLGQFKTPEEASFAYKEAADKYHGEFAFHNREKDTN